MLGSTPLPLTPFAGPVRLFARSSTATGEPSRGVGGRNPAVWIAYCRGPSLIGFEGAPGTFHSRRQTSAPPLPLFASFGAQCRRCRHCCLPASKTECNPPPGTLPTGAHRRAEAAWRPHRSGEHNLIIHKDEAGKLTVCKNECRHQVRGCSLRWASEFFWGLLGVRRNACAQGLWCFL